MATRKIRHLIDFIQMAERNAPDRIDCNRVQVRHPEEEVRIGDWAFTEPHGVEGHWPRPWLKREVY